MPEPGNYAGLLFIGDPHVASRAPGYRKDDYPRAILEKLRWALGYASNERLLPIILGDLFDYPRDNANWLLVELLTLFRSPVLCVYGNHDCKENTPTENDTLSILTAAHRLHVLDGQNLWTGIINGMHVTVGGTSWGQRLPESLDASSHPTPRLVFWAAHHDVRFPGYEEAARFAAYEIPGVDMVVNGHIHRCLDDVRAGATTWINPGNIARVKRSDASKQHTPGVLRIDIADGGWTKSRIEVPHAPFEEVFHPSLEPQAADVPDSVFIRELATLESIRTARGAGLRSFLEANLPQFDGRVAAAIWELAEEVLSHE